MVYNRPCWVEISTDALESNYRQLSQVSSPLELLAIVKANAYGHGLAICAPAVERAGARWLGVTSVEEGVAARALCPTEEVRILIISGPFPGQGTAVIAHNLTCVVWDAWQLDELEAAARLSGCNSVPVHLELDTGMNRQGVGSDHLDGILARFTPTSPLRLDGVMTHLYAADESDGLASREQLARLGAMVERVLHTGLRPAWLHVGNSAAVLAGAVLIELSAIAAQSGMKAMARPGLALYGLAPEFAPDEPAPVTSLRAKLQPVLTWKTQVVSVREIPAGQVIGYNGTFIATEPMRVALLAVGYGDGLKRALSNRGHVLLRGERAPIVGRISMDQTVVDVTGIADVAPHDEVVLLGRQGNLTIRAEDHAEWAGTIVWEIFTSISERVERFTV